jgi:predicted exporter
MSARRLSLGIWLLLVVLALAYATTRLSIESDFSVFLPRGLNDSQQTFLAQLRNGAVSRLVLIALEDDEPQALAKLSAAFAGALDKDPSFTYVNNGGSAFAQRELNSIAAVRYVLSDRVTSDRFSAGGLRAALEKRLEGLAGSAGAFEKTLLASDPTGETLHVLQRLTPDRQPRRIDDAWFDESGKRALLVVETRASGSDLVGQDEALMRLGADFGAVRGERPARMRYSSPGAMAVESRTLIARDVAWLSLLSTVLVLLILGWVYRSPLVVLVCIVPALSGLLAGIVAVDLGFGSVHAIALGFGATLLGEAVDYPSYLLTQRRANESMHDTLARILPMLRLAVATTTLGALALLLSHFSGLAQLGLLTVVGVVVAGLVTALVLPHLIPPGWHPRATIARPARLPAAFVGIGPRVGIVLIVATTVVALAARRSWWDDDLAHMNPLPATVLAQDRQLRQALNAPEVGSLLMVSGATREDALRTVESLRPALEGWQAAGDIGSFTLVSDYLPSAATQATRQAALPAPQRLRSDLDAALTGLPFRADTFEPFLRDVEQARTAKPLTPEALRGSALGLKVDALLSEQGARWSAIVPMTRVAHPGMMPGKVAALGIPGAQWIELRAQAAAMVSAYRRQTLTYTAIGILMIVGALAYGLKSWRRAIQVLLPVVLALALTMGTLVASGQPVSIFHLVALLLTLGIGTNYALFLARARQAGAEHGGTLRTLAVVGGTTLCAFGALTLSSTPVLHAIGMTVCLGVIYSLLLSLLLLWPRSLPSTLPSTSTSPPVA